jgi:hypothetical protein
MFVLVDGLRWYAFIQNFIKDSGGKGAGGSFYEAYHIIINKERRRLS